MRPIEFGMRIEHLHTWDLTPVEAMALQRELASRVVISGDPREEDVGFVAGSDVAFDKPNGRAVGAVVVLAWPSLDVVEQVVVEEPVRFPYVPGLLSFRETPVLLAAFERLACTPDLLMVDGHGRAHPRRFGYASHIGLLLGIPTIGVAKSRLVGEQGTVAGPRGSRTDLVDDGEVIGALVRTRQGVRSIYVSSGSNIGLAAAERWVLACARGYRLPEPTRLADRLAGVAKRRMLALTLDVVIEQRAGEPGRWEWMPEDQAIVFRHDLPPMVTHYGCSTHLVNPADGELIDVMIVEDRPRERAEHMTVRVIDVLERSDGDHKLLALPVEDASTEAMTATSLDDVRERVWRWYVEQKKPVVRWGGEDRALAAIDACRVRGE
jgi:deoxyribonuclease V